MATATSGENGATPAASADNAAAPAPAAGGETTTPFSAASKEAAEILRQADLVKQQNQQMAEELNYLRAEKQKAETEYAKEREPQLKKYLEHLESKTGKPLDAEEKRINERVFSKPEYKREADRRWQEFQDNVAVTASLKARDQELATLRAQHEELLKTQNKLAQSFGPSAMRASYAQAVAQPDLTSAVNASAVPGTTKEAASVAASAGGLALGEIMGVAPSATERQLGFLQEYNFPTEFGVRASNGTGKQLRMSMPAAPEHSLLLDHSTGERNFPASMRYHAPHIFSRYANDRSYLDNDNVHASVVVRNALGNFEQVINDVNVSGGGSFLQNLILFDF